MNAMVSPAVQSPVRRVMGHRGKSRPDYVLIVFHISQPMRDQIAAVARHYGESSMCGTTLMLIEWGLEHPCVRTAHGPYLHKVAIEFDDETFAQVRDRSERANRSFSAELRELVAAGLDVFGRESAA